MRLQYGNALGTLTNRDKQQNQTFGFRKTTTTVTMCKWLQYADVLMLT